MMGITVFVPGFHCVVMTFLVAGAVNGPRLRLGPLTAPATNPVITT